MEWIGIQLDARGQSAQGRVISAAGSPVALVLKTDEERMIARHTAEMLGLKQPLVPAIS